LGPGYTGGTRLGYLPRARRAFLKSCQRKSFGLQGRDRSYKLYIKPPARYSEDIDLVQMTAEAAEPVMEAIRSVLDPWLGTPLETDGWTDNLRLPLCVRGHPSDRHARLKIEANTREHFAVHGFKTIHFSVSSALR
jgi:hypothetical protein